MVETTLPDELDTSGQRASLILAYFWTFLSFCVLDDFFPFKNMGFWVFLVHPTVVSVLLSASVKICFVSRMRDFYCINVEFVMRIILYFQ